MFYTLCVKALMRGREQGLMYRLVPICMTEVARRVEGSGQAEPAMCNCFPVAYRCLSVDQMFQNINTYIRYHEDIG